MDEPTGTHPKLVRATRQLREHLDDAVRRGDITVDEAVRRIEAVRLDSETDPAGERYVGMRPGERET